MIDVSLAVNSLTHLRRPLKRVNWFRVMEWSPTSENVFGGSLMAGMVSAGAASRASYRSHVLVEFLGENLGLTLSVAASRRPGNGEGRGLGCPSSTVISEGILSAQSLFITSSPALADFRAYLMTNRITRPSRRSQGLTVRLLQTLV